MKHALILSLVILAGCLSVQPETPGDFLWFVIFEEVQDAGGTCEDQTLAFRNRLHDEIGVPYSGMRLVRSRKRSNLKYHLRLRVWIARAGEWRTFDPANDGFNWPEDPGVDYWDHETKVVFPGNYRLPGARPGDYP